MDDAGTTRMDGELPMGAETTFKLGEALEAQGAMRRSLGLPEEVFPVEAFVGMISDEIEASRRAGTSSAAES